MPSSVKSSGNILALSGGVGGAKLALGLAHEVAAEQLTIVANTADDFEHLGLYIAPDLDTVMYTLAGINNQEQGWGLAGESWGCMSAMQRLQGETWFRLGDQDLATHLVRTQALKSGQSLSDVTARLCHCLEIPVRLLPMCNEKVSTVVHTDEGDLPFQRYFVERQCVPAVSGFSFVGIENSRIDPALQQAIVSMDAMVICPSNPFVSIAPILSVSGLRNALRERDVPRIVVSPIIAGTAIKGPAAKMMKELDLPVTAMAVADHYRGFATHFVLDTQDSHYAGPISAMGYTVMITNTLMKTLDDRRRLARDILQIMPG